jgi:hypothetical protein
LTPSLMKPNRGWRRCGQPTRDDATDDGPIRLSPGLARRFQAIGP